MSASSDIESEIEYGSVANLQYLILINTSIINMFYNKYFKVKWLKLKYLKKVMFDKIEFLPASIAIKIHIASKVLEEEDNTECNKDDSDDEGKNNYSNIF